MSKNNYKDLIDEIINEVEKELEESTATGNVAGYQTPNAFGNDSKKSKDKTKKVATQAGYTVVNDDIRNINEGADWILLSSIDKMIDSYGGFLMNTSDPMSSYKVYHNSKGWKHLFKKASTKDKKTMTAVVKSMSESINEGKFPVSKYRNDAKFKYSFKIYLKDGEKHNSDFYDLKGALKMQKILDKAKEVYSITKWDDDSGDEISSLRYEGLPVKIGFNMLDHLKAKLATTLMYDTYTLSNLKGSNGYDSTKKEISPDKWNKTLNDLTIYSIEKLKSLYLKKHSKTDYKKIRKQVGLQESKRVKEQAPKKRTNRWLELKNDDSMHGHKKLAMGLKELKYQLKEVETFFRWYNQIKNINELETDGYWKRTNKHIRTIKERLINIVRTIQEIEK